MALDLTLTDQRHAGKRRFLPPSLMRGDPVFHTSSQRRPEDPRVLGRRGHSALDPHQPLLVLVHAVEVKDILCQIQADSLSSGLPSRSLVG